MLASCSRKTQNYRALSEERAIRALAARFSDLSPGCDAQGFGALWAPEAVWEIGPSARCLAVGPKAIVSLFRELWAPWDFFVSMTHNGFITQQENQAQVRWTMEIVDRTDDGVRSYHNFVLYEEELVRVNDVWKLTRCSYTYSERLPDAPLPGRVFRLPTAEARETPHAGAREFLGCQ